MQIVYAMQWIGNWCSGKQMEKEDKENRKQNKITRRMHYFIHLFILSRIATLILHYRRYWHEYSRQGPVANETLQCLPHFFKHISSAAFNTLPLPLFHHLLLVVVGRCNVNERVEDPIAMRWLSATVDSFQYWMRKKDPSRTEYKRDRDCVIKLENSILSILWCIISRPIICIHRLHLLYINNRL